jgi:hypothetical protein
LRYLPIYESSSSFYTVNITRGATYRFRYRAANVNGWGGWSPEGYAKAASIPSAPQPPTLVSSDSTTLVVRINPSLDNGGSPILSYQLYMDAGTLSSSFTLLNDYDGVSSTFEVTQADEGITSGLSYRFFTVAVNAIGESEPSNEATFAVTNLPQ